VKLVQPEITCDAILIATMIIAAYTDWRFHKIYNWMTFSGMAAGLGVRAGFTGTEGAALSLLGLVVGLLIQLAPFALKLIKAGDVKLLMMVGALEGWEFTLWGFLYGAAAFGLLAIFWLWRDGTLRQTLRNAMDFLKVLGWSRAINEPGPPASQRMMPWGIGLALGFLIAVAMKHGWGSPSLIP